MYQVLYRKYRPKVFADVVGQPQVTVTLKNELTAGRISHAYLFTGSRGTGKTTCAKILAKAVNCLSPVDGDPCGECEICRGIDSGAVMDIVEIDAASNNGVENIRTLREEANFTPAAAKYRVYIIDEVHMLSIGAFNALLKTLEEPPAHVVFILATTEVHKIPATILSRCQRFDFRRIPPEDVAARLDFVTKQENGEIDPDGALMIARLSDGALRDALSLLDQCLGRDRHVTAEVVRQTAGLVGRDHLFALSAAIHEGNSAAALEQIDGLHNASKDMSRLCEELSSHYRDMMLVKTMKDPRTVLAVTDGELEALTKQALATPLPEILHCLDAFQRTLERMYRGGNRRTEMEMTLLRLCTPELDTSLDALLRRVSALEHGSPALRGQTAAPERASGQAGSAPSPAVQAAPLPEPPPPPADPPAFFSGEARQASAPSRPEPPVTASSAEEIQANAQRLDVWPEILQVLSGYSKAISSAFTGSCAYVSGDYVLIDAKDMAFELLRRSAQRDKMRDAIRQVTGRVYKLGPYKKQQKEEKSDPLAQLAGLAEQAGIEVIKK